MALTYSTMEELGSAAPDFSLPATDGKTYGLASFRNHRALVVVFMCNHCPYVIATQGRINQIAKDYGSKGVAVVGVNSNDPGQKPADSFDAMKARAHDEGFVFPYLFDESQEVAKAYKAVCTPDFYVYENKGSHFVLAYRGMLDDSWKDETAVTKRPLRDALDAILESRAVSSDQKPSMGCSIKWKA